jgi:hypothetical protein
MDGVAIFVIALLMLLCVVGILYTMREMIKLDAMSVRRQVQREIIPADWDRIMKDTQLERRKGKK